MIRQLFLGHILRLSEFFDLLADFQHSIHPVFYWKALSELIIKPFLKNYHTVSGYLFTTAG